MGRPRKIKDAADLARVVDDYINYNISCNQVDIVLPTDYDFCTYVGIGHSTLNDYMRESEKYREYSAALKKLVDYREQFFATLAVRNPKAASAAIFALKQPKNGGYQDKPAVTVSARELKIITGDGITDDSFS